MEDGHELTRRPCAQVRWHSQTAPQRARWQACARRRGQRWQQHAPWTGLRMRRRRRWQRRRWVSASCGSAVQYVGERGGGRGAR